MTSSNFKEISLDKRQWHPSPLADQVVLVTSMDREGKPNVAPKSWITMITFGPPPRLLFGCNLQHNTARNVRDTKQFVVNVPGEDLSDLCWRMGTDKTVRGAARFDHYRLTPVPSRIVKPPRIAECRACLECELEEIREWGEEVAIIGRMVAAAVDSEALDGDTVSQYRFLAPFFFLEGSCMAAMGPAKSPYRDKF